MHYQQKTFMKSFQLLSTISLYNELLEYSAQTLLAASHYLRSAS